MRREPKFDLHLAVPCQLGDKRRGSRLGTRLANPGEDWDVSPRLDPLANAGIRRLDCAGRQGQDNSEQPRADQIAAPRAPESVITSPSAPVRRTWAG